MQDDNNEQLKQQDFKLELFKYKKILLILGLLFFALIVGIGIYWLNLKLSAD